MDVVVGVKPVGYAALIAAFGERQCQSDGGTVEYAQSNEKATSAVTRF